MAVGDDPVQGPFELADVREGARGQDIKDILGQLRVQPFCLLPEDRRARLIVRRLDVDDEAAFEPGLDTFFQE